MRSWRENPDSEECARASRANDREVFALQMEAKGKTMSSKLKSKTPVDPLVAAIEIQRNEWKAIAEEALASFRCTQRPEIYPEGHWSRRAQILLENDLAQ